MTTTDVYESAPPRTVVAEPSHLRWGAIFGGTVAALGLAVMLYSLGLALGLSSLDPADPGTLRPSGIFTGIWALVVSLLALFVGGFVAARGARALTRSFGALHGLVMWGLTVVAGLWLLGNIASSLASGAAAVSRTATQAISGIVPNMDPGAIASSMGISSQEALAPVNQRLRAAGQPEVTVAQLSAATREVVQSAIRQGSMDRTLLITAISNNTALSRADAEEVATRMSADFGRARNQASQSLERVKTDALAAAEDSGKAFWGAFGALFLGMLSAIGGSLVGGGPGAISRREMVDAPSKSRPGPPREAYP